MIVRQSSEKYIKGLLQM